MRFAISRFRLAVSAGILFALFVVLGPSAICENSFDVKRVGNIHSYGENAFRVYSAENGNLKITIHDEICVYRELSERISAGETLIRWDGCAYNKEKLYEKTYTVTAEMETDSGLFHTISFLSPVEYPEQYLQYALPSSYNMYLDTPDSWFLEYKTVKNGTVILTLSDNRKEEIQRYKLPSTGGKILRKSFSDFSKDRIPPEGEYTLAIYELSRPEEKYEYQLAVSAHRPEKIPVTVTGEIMPDRSMTDEEIWKMMMAPSVVVDMDFFKHQNVYEKQDTSSRSLGTLHGQTQGLKVITIDGNWAFIGAWNHEDGEYVEGWVPLDRLKMEKPAPDYGLLIDKKTQTMSVFRNGKVIDTLYVSTGRAERNSLYQETSAGCFLTGYHRVNFSTNGKKYDYVIQYDGGNLLHQTPYEWGKNKKDFTYGRAYLGAKASHACIRIQPEPAAGGINAYWIFTHLPYQTRVIILDDEDERRAAHDKLKRPENKEYTKTKDRADTEGKEESSETVTLTFGGSVIPGGSRQFNTRKESFVSSTKKEGYRKVLSDMIRIFSEDDFTCLFLGGILEGSIEIKPEMRGVQYGPKGMNELFADSSVELLAVTGDALLQNEELYAETKKEAGAYAQIIDRAEPELIEIKGHLFGFAACSESEYLSDPDIIYARIKTLENRQCEKTVFLVSQAEGNSSIHSIVQEAIANRAVLAGADCVIFNQNGQAKGIEYIRDVPVIYNSGTILDGSTGKKPRSFYSMLVQVQFCFQSGIEGTSVSVIPVLPYGDGESEQNAYHPVIARGQREAGEFIGHIRNDSTDVSLSRIYIRTGD